MRIYKQRGMHLTKDGKIILPTGKIAESKPQNGRYRCNLSVDGKPLMIMNARIICFLAWGEPPTPTSVADHIDGDTLNDSPENLRWATYSENTRNNVYTREKTWEHKCIQACGGIKNPDAISELIQAARIIVELDKNAKGLKLILEMLDGKA